MKKKWLERKNTAGNQQGWPNHWEVFQKLKLVSVLQELLRTETSQYNCHIAKTKSLFNWRSILPGQRGTRTGRVKISDESTCCILFGSQGPRVWGRVERNLWGVWISAKTFHSLCCFEMPCHGARVWSAVSSPKSTQPSIRRLWRLQASTCWHPLWRCCFPFPAGPSTCPQC